MGYPGFCAKYGEKNVIISTLLMSEFIVNAVSISQGDWAASDLASGLIAGCTAFVGGYIAHPIVEKRLRANHIGMSTGAFLTKTAQFMAAGVGIFAGSMLFDGAINEFDEMKRKKPHHSHTLPREITKDRFIQPMP